MISTSPNSSPMKFTFNFEKGDNLFDIIFELDRKLQMAQQPTSSTTFLTDTYAYIDAMMLRAAQTQPDIIDVIFLKLVDFFIKCNNNFKRFKLSSMFKSSDYSASTWLGLVKSKSEAFRRICQLWDSTVSTDFEASRQILLLMAACHQCFHSLSASYGIFYEALAIDEESSVSSFGSVVYHDLAISTCSLYLLNLFKDPKPKPETESESQALLAVKNFASLTTYHAILPFISATSNRKNDKLEEIIFICTNFNPALSNKKLINKDTK